MSVWSNIMEQMDEAAKNVASRRPSTMILEYSTYFYIYIYIHIYIHICIYIYVYIIYFHI